VTNDWRRSFLDAFTRVNTSVCTDIYMFFDGRRAERVSVRPTPKWRSNALGIRVDASVMSRDVRGPCVPVRTLQVHARHVRRIGRVVESRFWKRVARVKRHRNLTCARTSTDIACFSKYSRYSRNVKGIRYGNGTRTRRPFPLRLSTFSSDVYLKRVKRTSFVKYRYVSSGW